MPKQNEAGNAINVANFEDLISFCTGYGAPYNPSKKSLTLPELDNKHLQAKAAMDAVNNALPANTNAINARELVFAPLTKLVTRIPYAVDASDAPANAVADVKTLVRKLQGKRATPKKTDDPATPPDESAQSISASQLSFDSRVENLDKLIKLLAGLPGYKPNETELTVASLNSMLVNMKAANSVVINSATPLSNARIKRNDELYHPQTGLLAVAADVKAYVKSVFGLSSPQYKQLTKLKFKTIKV